ncbi:MAG: hypothetical protein P8Z35_10570, partial [Ignavibacteriaceae bacterium]
MKKLLLLVSLLLFFIGFTYTRIIDSKIKNILDKIQLSENSADDMIFSNCSNPSFYFPNPKELKNLAAGDKVAIVNEVGNYVKEYTATKDFLNKYIEYKNGNKPEPPEKPKSVAELKKEQKESIKKGIEDLEKTKAQMPEDQRASFDETIKSLKEQLKEVDDPNNPMYSAQMENNMKQMYEEQMKEYKEKVAQWEKEYPPSPGPMIKTWLTKFLEGSKDVDFNAELAENQSGKKVFVKQSYENNSDLWKVC